MRITDTLTGVLVACGLIGFGLWPVMGQWALTYIMIVGTVLVLAVHDGQQTKTAPPAE